MTTQSGRQRAPEAFTKNVYFPTVFTSFALHSPRNLFITKTTQSIIKFKRLHPDEIDYYLASKEWEGKAGGYAIQGIAASFINFISGYHSASVYH